jgi:hypothetical protein
MRIYIESLGRSLVVPYSWFPQPKSSWILGLGVLFRSQTKSWYQLQVYIPSRRNIVLVESSRRHLGAMLGDTLKQFDGPWGPSWSHRWGYLGPRAVLSPRGPPWGLLGPSCGLGEPMRGQWPLVRAGSQCTSGSGRESWGRLHGRTHFGVLSETSWGHVGTHLGAT